MKFSARFYLVTCLLLAAVYSHAQDAKQNVNIVFVGNSITRGAGLQNAKEESPPNETCAWLRKQPGIGEVAFSNQGVSGHTTVDVLPATNTDFPKIVAAARTFSNNNAQLIFSIKLGTNDSAVKGPKGAPVSKEDYYNNLKTITDSLLSAFPHCKVVFQQPIWYSPNTHNRSTYMQEGLDRLESYFPKLRDLVKAYKKTNPGRVYLGDIKAFKYFKKHHTDYLVAENGKFGVFYLHPNKAGAVVLGDFWAKAIYRAVVDR